MTSVVWRGVQRRWPGCERGAAWLSRGRWCCVRPSRRTGPTTPRAAKKCTLATFRTPCLRLRVRRVLACLLTRLVGPAHRSGCGPQVPSLVSLSLMCVVVGSADIWNGYDTVESYVHVLTMLWICLTYDGVAVRTLQGEQRLIRFSARPSAHLPLPIPRHLLPLPRCPRRGLRCRCEAIQRGDVPQERGQHPGPCHADTNPGASVPVRQLQLGQRRTAIHVFSRSRPGGNGR